MLLSASDTEADETESDKQKGLTMASPDNAHGGIVGLVLLVGGVALMETKGALEGVGFIMMVIGIIMLIAAWRGRSK